MITYRFLETLLIAMIKTVSTESKILFVSLVLINCFLIIFKIFGFFLNANRWKGWPVLTFTVFSSEVYWEPFEADHHVPEDLGSCPGFITNPDICPQMDVSTLSPSFLLGRAGGFQRNILILSQSWDSKKRKILRKRLILYYFTTYPCLLLSLCCSKF